jgi:hypothetical protein
LLLVRTLCYDQVYDLLLFNHKLGRNIQCSDQKQIVNLVVTYSVLTSNKS